VITATAKRRKGHHHDVEVDGHALVVDEPTEAGGTNEGPSPTRLLAASLASCTAITIGMYADRKEWDIDDLEVAVDFEGTPTGAETAKFKIRLDLPDGLDEDQVNRIRTIAAKCPVHRTLTGRVEIEVVDEKG
jgi:putative redox protein